MSALFKEIEIQENAIRKDPINRTTELLQKYLITLTNSKTPFDSQPLYMVLFSIGLIADTLARAV